jgi:hypothetical protein
MTQSTLARQIEEARVELKKLKKHCPYLFHEYHELREARTALALAKARLVKALQRWEEL